MGASVTTRLVRDGARASFRVEARDHALDSVLLKMGFTRSADTFVRSFPDSERIPRIYANFSRHIEEMVRHQTGEAAPLWDVALRGVIDRLEGKVGWWLSGSAALARNDGLNWPHCDGLNWPHLV
jgi:hypothetical protein